MTVHYVNLPVAGDLTVGAAEAEVLLYVPDRDGFRLVGVECS